MEEAEPRRRAFQMMETPRSAVQVLPGSWAAWPADFPRPVLQGDPFCRYDSRRLDDCCISPWHFCCSLFSAACSPHYLHADLGADRVTIAKIPQAGSPFVSAASIAAQRYVCCRLGNPLRWSAAQAFCGSRWTTATAMSMKEKLRFEQAGALHSVWLEFGIRRSREPPWVGASRASCKVKVTRYQFWSVVPVTRYGVIRCLVRGEPGQPALRERRLGEIGQDVSQALPGVRCASLHRLTHFVAD